jgi:hypothetical protein
MSLALRFGRQPQTTNHPVMVWYLLRNLPDGSGLLHKRVADESGSSPKSAISKDQ